MTNDEKFMELAINLARQGSGKVSPNPIVGAVVVKDGNITGQGYHEQYGEAHAEVIAIENSRDQVCGSTLYVTLEPCNHYGNTPPCSQRIVAEKIKSVVIGSIDPDPRMRGKSVICLQNKGIDVETGILKNQTDELIRFYACWKKTKRPYVAVKLAVTHDRFIAQSDGTSKWISCRASREEVHQMRGDFDAVLVGTNTILKDDPALTVRLIPGRNPNRVIIDRLGKVSPNARVMENNTNKIFYFSTVKRNDLSNWVNQIQLDKSEFSLETILSILGEQNQISLLVEGGEQLASSFISHSLCNEVVIYRSPLTFGRGISFKNSLINTSQYEIFYISQSDIDEKIIYRRKHV